MTSQPRCRHGRHLSDWSTFDMATERSACCGAAVTVFTDDGSWYCKCCGCTVEPA